MCLEKVDDVEGPGLDHLVGEASGGEGCHCLHDVAGVAERMLIVFTIIEFHYLENPDQPVQNLLAVGRVDLLIPEELDLDAG